MEKVVTRFPPSPTGYLHIGGARTALFNWLLARSRGGTFILRIEDTDLSRSSQEMTDSILESLDWLGIDWDEGPYFQSQRFDVYQNHIDYLLKTGQAYYCQCSAEEVEAMRQEAWERGEKPKYNGTCRELGLEPGPGRVVRFKAPLTGEVGFQDLIRGANSVEAKELDDFVLRRADNSPTYNLAVVVDDATMGITHILRGDDHLSNTPKQILLYDALGYPLPHFGHVPMILGPGKKKLSKRHGAMSVLEYRDFGYLPEALMNYLVRLGWSYGDQELFQVKELIHSFSLDNVGKSACVFDTEKLEWVNSQHLKSAEIERIAHLLHEQILKRGLGDYDLQYLKKIVPLYQPRAKTISEIVDLGEFFFLADHDLTYDPDLVEMVITPEVKVHLQKIRTLLQQLETFTQDSLQEALAQYLEDESIRFKVIAQPIRVAITGRKASPGLFETMEVLGQDSVVQRMAMVTE
jgi:glutamyl-tRNA synthetase